MSEQSLVPAGKRQAGLADTAQPCFPAEGEFMALVSLADRIADTEFVPATLRKRPAAVLACIMAGREMGIGPMQSLQKINVIQGRPAPSAELMRSLVLSAGHRLVIEEYTDQRCTVVGQRRGDATVTRVTFGAEEAKRAQLSGKEGGMYSRYPRSMFLARATSELCRAIFPDVLAGFSYTPEDVMTMQPEPVPVIRPVVDASTGETREVSASAIGSEAAQEQWTYEQYVTEIQKRLTDPWFQTPPFSTDEIKALIKSRISGKADLENLHTLYLEVKDGKYDRQAEGAAA